MESVRINVMDGRVIELSIHGSGFALEIHDDGTYSEIVKLTKLNATVLRDTLDALLSEA